MAVEPHSGAPVAPLATEISGNSAKWLAPGESMTARFTMRVGAPGEVG